MRHRSRALALGALALAALGALAAACGDNLEPAAEDCGAGFEASADGCVDIDECARGVAACDPRAACTNEEGAYACACPSGWIGDGAACALAPCRYDYRAGHGDMYASWDEAAGLSLALRSELEAGAGERVYAPAEVCIHVPQVTYAEVAELGGRPPGAGWDPVGVAEGEAFWYLPEQPLDGVPWFGLASDPGPLGGIPVGVFADTMTVEVRVDAPPGGAFSAWSSVEDPEAPPFLFSTADARVRAPVITSSHAHLSWAFTAPGEYLVEAVVSGELAEGGGARASAPEIFRFVVEPVTP